MIKSLKKIIITLLCIYGVLYLLSSLLWWSLAPRDYKFISFTDENFINIQETFPFEIPKKENIVYRYILGEGFRSNEIDCLVLKDLDNIEYFLTEKLNFDYENPAQKDKHKLRVKEFLDDKLNPLEPIMIKDENLDDKEVLGKTLRLSYLRFYRSSINIIIFEENEKRFLIIENVSEFY